MLWLEPIIIALTLGQDHVGSWIPVQKSLGDYCTWKLCWKTVTYIFGNRLVDCFSSKEFW